MHKASLKGRNMILDEGHHAAVGYNSTAVALGGAAASAETKKQVRHQTECEIGWVRRRVKFGRRDESTQS